MSDFDSETALYSQVGFIVIQWGHCEQSLELLVNTLFREFGGNALPKRKRMPRPLVYCFVIEGTNYEAASPSII